MMKHLSILMAILLTNFLTGQEITEVELEEKNEILFGFSFDTSLCSEQVIFETWSNWVHQYGAKPNLIKRLINRYETDGFQLTSYETGLKVRLLIFENENGANVVNVFQKTDGSYLRENSPNFGELQERLTNLKHEIQRNCLRNELEQANDFLQKLQTQATDLEKEKRNQEKNIAKLNNQKLRLLNKQEKTKSRIAFYEKKIDQGVNSKKQTKYEKKIQSLKEGYEKYTQEFENKNTEIEQTNKDIEDLINSIKAKNEEITNQNLIIDDIKIKLNPLEFEIE